ncbi:ABC transporter permease [Microvirga aerophila]|uniref:ABC transporter permease n=1 Tax=Microvirga aerophila TaxID=670291 RepID=A0A512BT50_9HYPH|nr:ABC transporter permease [Microvirga aerophila]GEO15094.1 ABC transporter permease [Microvirga aerophila]
MSVVGQPSVKAQTPSGAEPRAGRVAQSLIKFAFMLKTVWAVLAALILGAFLVQLAGGRPVAAYSALFEGAFADYYGISSTLVRMSPLLLASLAVIIPLRAGLFNIGAEGQIYIGALLSTLVALYLPEVLPSWIHVIACIGAGALGGALWGLIPAALKAYRGTNEIITSLLLSYVAVYTVGAVLHAWLMEPGAPYPYSREIPDALVLPTFLSETEAHIGVLIAVAAALVIAVIFRQTTLGLSIQTVGHNPHAAVYAGLDVKRLTLSSFALGGAMAGLAGAFEVLGLKYRLFDHFSPGYGMQGIIVAFLAALSPLGSIVAAFFLAGLQVGAGAMQRTTGIDTTMVEALQGMIVLFVAIGLAFRYHPERWSRRVAAWQKPTQGE